MFSCILLDGWFLGWRWFLRGHLVQWSVGFHSGHCLLVFLQVFLVGQSFVFEFNRIIIIKVNVEAIIQEERLPLFFIDSEIFVLDIG